MIIMRKVSHLSLPKRPGVAHVGRAPSATVDAQALNARRLWVIDQLASLVRNGAIPKDDGWVMTVLNWFVVRGLFVVKKGNAKSTFLAVCYVALLPVKPLMGYRLVSGTSGTYTCLFRRAAKSLSRSTAFLSSRVDNPCDRGERRSFFVRSSESFVLFTLSPEDKPNKTPGVASDGIFWIVKTLHSITLLKETMHVRFVVEVDKVEKLVYEKAMETVEALTKVCFVTPFIMLYGRVRVV
jgi:DNA polymerase phi